MRKIFYVFVVSIFLFPIFAAGESGERSIYLCVKPLEALASISKENNGGYSRILMLDDGEEVPLDIDRYTIAVQEKDGFLTVYCSGNGEKSVKGGQKSLKIEGVSDVVKQQLLQLRSKKESKDVGLIEEISSRCGCAHKDDEDYCDLSVDKLSIKDDAFFKVRHCFMAFASKESDGKLPLVAKDTYGYGRNGDNPDSLSKESWAAPERDVRKSTCIVVLEESDLKKDEKMRYKWSDVIDVMDNEVKDQASKTSRDYNLFGHNCCTVAYKVLESIGGHKERMNEKSFNLYGLGIVWGQNLGYVSKVLLSSSTLLEGDKSNLLVDKKSQNDAEKESPGSEIPVDKEAADSMKDDL